MTNDERNEKICDLRGKGLTPAQICRRLRLSRGVVNGVLWREGLCVQRKAVLKSKKLPKPVRRRKIAMRALVQGLCDVRALEIEPIPLGTDAGCQWVHGEPADHVMCGHTPLGRSSWCPHHYSRVFQEAM